MSTRNDLDLKAFKAILLSEKAKIDKNIELIKVELNSIGLDGELDEIIDMAEIEIENSTDHTLLEKLEAEREEINAALNRIALGTYGMCEKTGEPIPVERLRVNPSARTVVNV
ncbi:MAG: conjugal transfer protein TraR [Sulfuricurvum sp. RIFOXYD2_FULL_44_160]|uniref:TraR/DksA family transcriptional regulator n=1 Tax=unclassified Sulfuricurvum TaxID=2632390 RepID=UPI0008CC75F9|nr:MULTISPECIES: TraR/DksA C4-type zinc finger protein [unclassified Sulfuricurvum]OHD91979.1 MAG: conjugal transfer protein TraR [Sulfuricurvum sp. RIFOXYD12_FULL_44_77]OHD93190.1 MAG: conjugal transfer protein TraR [Sulfuricurvum sp. RIFOXYD2_FULL_44_160]